MDDFLDMGLIGVVYGLSELINSWGFLAVFFAAVSLRPTEVGLINARASGRAHAIAHSRHVGLVRGARFGSLCYLRYAIEHGRPEVVALELIHMTLTVITMSILTHSASVKPLMNHFWRAG